GDELGERVHPHGELALCFLHRRPGGCEPLEGHTPQEQRVAREQLVGLVLGELVVEVGVRPAAVLDLPDAAWVGQPAVEGHVFRCHYLAHLYSFLSLRPADSGRRSFDGEQLAGPRLGEHLLWAFPLGISTFRGASGMMGKPLARRSCSAAWAVTRIS